MMQLHLGDSITRSWEQYWKRCTGVTSPSATPTVCRPG